MADLTTQIGASHAARNSAKALEEMKTLKEEIKTVKKDGKKALIISIIALIVAAIALIPVINDLLFHK